MRAWHQHRLPHILGEYEILDAEVEFPHVLTEGLEQMVRLDARMRHREMGGLEILEFKTVSSPSYDWEQQWERNLQIITNSRGVEQFYGERCEGVKIEGLVLGMRRMENAKSSPFKGLKIRDTPYCYAWKTKDAFDNTVYERSYQAARIWKKCAIYDEPGMTPTKWVATFTEKELNNLFVPRPSVRPVPRLVERWRQQTVAQELRIHAALDKYEMLMAEGLEWEAEEVLYRTFPQHVGACKKYHAPCAFEDACFDDGIGKDPVGSGLYQIRVPHHTAEEE
jgi:hypothetical protein